MADELGVAVMEVIDNEIYAPPTYPYMDCRRQLLFDFRNIFTKDIDRILDFHRGHYAKAYKSLSLVVNAIRNKLPVGLLGNEQRGSKSDFIKLTITDGRRKPRTFSIHGMNKIRFWNEEFDHTEDLRMEVARVKEEMKNHDENTNRQLAMNLLEEDYLKLGQLIECSCCYGNCVFDLMAQCTDGHLVCVECLNAYAKEIVFGAGNVTVGCMLPDCPVEYPPSELKRCLSSEIWNKLQERSLNENLSKAQIEGLVRCPYCDFAAILTPEVKVFVCHKDGCKKATCKDCGADWAGHQGLPCSMVEGRGETSLRKEYEEKMTKAKVRVCSNCNAQFTKESGCNKMVCRCGMTMCYICRTPRITYGHFCGHPRDPGKPCTVCASCSLWTNPEMDEERAIEEIRREAQTKRKALELDADLIIRSCAEMVTKNMGTNPISPSVTQDVRGFDDEKPTGAPKALKLS